MDKMYPDYGCQETYDGEPITGLVPFKGKLLVFTPSKVYTFRKFKWYEQAWHRVQSAFRTVARKLKSWFGQ